MGHLIYYVVAKAYLATYTGCERACNACIMLVDIEILIVTKIILPFVYRSAKLISEDTTLQWPMVTVLLANHRDMENDLPPKRSKVGRHISRTIALQIRKIYQ